MVHPVNGEVPPVKGRPRKLPHYANRGKTSSSGGELASARSCFSTVRTALGKLRITGLLAQFDIARSFPQFPRPLLLQPTILTSERGTRFGIRKAPNHVPPPHLPDDPNRCPRGGGGRPRRGWLITSSWCHAVLQFFECSSGSPGGRPRFCQLQDLAPGTGRCFGLAEGGLVQGT